jgi:O-antigen/teichoic acid export membrane protein
MTEPTPLKQQVLHSLKWVALGKVATQIIRWLMTFWVIRLLMPEDYGVVAMADALFGFLTLIIGGLFTPSIIQAKELTEKILKQIFGAVLVVHGVVFLLQFFSADAVGLFYQSENVASILKLNAWCFLLLAFQVIPSAILARKMQFKKISIISAIANISAAIITFTLALLGYGFWALIIGEVAAIALLTIMVLWINPITFLPEFKLAEVKPFIRFGSLLTVHSIIFYVFVNIDVTIAGRVLSASEVGLFAIGLQFALMPQKKILPLLKQVAFPAFSQIQDQPERIKGYIIKAQKLSLIITIPIFWGLASVVDLVIPIVIGERWAGAIIPTMIMLLIMPLRFSEELFNPAIKSQQKAGHLLINAIIMLVLLMFGLLFFVGQGAVGLALAWACSFPVAYLIVLRRNCRLFEISLVALIKQFLAPLGAGFFMIFVVYGLKQIDNEVTALNMFSQILLGGGTFILSLIMFDRASVMEVKNLITRRT